MIFSLSIGSASMNDVALISKPCLTSSMSIFGMSIFHVSPSGVRGSPGEIYGDQHEEIFVLAVTLCEREASETVKLLVVKQAKRGSTIVRRFPRRRGRGHLTHVVRLDPAQAICIGDRAVMPAYPL